MTVWPGDMTLPGQGQRADGGPERSPARRGPSALGAPEESTFLQRRREIGTLLLGDPPSGVPAGCPLSRPGPQTPFCLETRLF